MAEVFELFNQTLTVGRRGTGDIDEDDEDEDSDDSEDDDDEEDDEDMKTSAVPPTPLPMPGTAPRVGMSMPTPSRMVPATPTPAQGYLSGRKQSSAVGAIFEEEDEELPVLKKPAFAIFSDENNNNVKPTVFADENAKPSVFQDENAPQKPIKMAVFGDENAPRPVFADENASKPVFQDENAQRTVFPDENAGSSNGSKMRESVFGQTPMKTPLAPRTTKPLAVASEAESPERSASVFADQRYTTPLPAKRVFGQAKPTTTLTETSEEGTVQEGEANADQEYLQDENGYNPRRIVRCGGAFDMMTPITERTCEYTQSTQGFTLRSSTSSALTQSQRKTMDDEEEFDLDEQEEELLAERQGLSVVQEESESSRVSDRQQSVHREQSPQVPFDEATGEQGSRRSDASHSLFQLSPGHTIQPRGAAERVVEEPVVAETESLPAAEASQAETPVAVESERIPSANPVDDDISIAALDISDARPEKLMVPVQDIPSPTSEAVVMFNPTNPCCPTDPDVMQPLIAALQPPITQLPNFVDLRKTTGGQLVELQKTAKSRVRRTSTSTGSKPPATGAWELTIHGRKFEIEDKIGEGGFGAVFKAIDLAARDAADEASDDEDEEANPEALYTLALKVEKPANVWEAVVLDRIRTRVAPEHHPSIVKSRGLYCYQDESILLLDYYNQGTLLDAVNKAAAWGIAAPAAGASGGFDETLAIFFTIELLRVIEALHRADFIHGDLKIDNCLIRLEETDEWVNQYEMNGESGWSGKGIHLIDLGRTIDLRAYPQGTAQTFVADWPVDAKDCQEMRDGRPWSYEADYYGLASICYCMLFGKYISTELAPAEPNDGEKKRYKINGSFKRVS
jgi:checkpoint serine/threonine-protein kinase